MIRLFDLRLTSLVLAFLMAGCATGVRPYAGAQMNGHGTRLELLQNEVQGSDLSVERTAFAGTYRAVLENNEYVFYEGTLIGERHHFRKWTGHGGIAVSRKHDRVAFLYTRDPLALVVCNRVSAPFVLRH